MCDCDATNEEILLSDCAKLRRANTSQTARIAALEAENARLRASLADIDPPIMRLQDAAQRAEVAEAERDALRAALEDIAQTTGRVGLFPTDTLIEILDVARAALAASTGEG